MKMRKVKGKKSGEMMDGPSKNAVYYPSISFDFDTLPEAKKWEVGKTYKIAIEAKQTSVREEKGGGSAGFDITGIGVMDHTSHLNDKKKSAKVARRYDEA